MEDKREPLVYRVNDACKLLCIGHSLFYEMAKAGKIKITKIGYRSVVTREEIKRVIAAGSQ